MSLSENPRAVIGANNPPANADPVLERLQADHVNLIDRRDALLAGMERAPTDIVSEDIAGKMADFVHRQIDPFIKESEATHKAEKQPYLENGRTVDGFLHALIDDIKRGKAALNVTRKRYADAKDAEKRRVREIAERKAREEQQRLERDAEEKAKAMDSDKDIAAAIDAEFAASQARVVADKATQAAAAKPAELGRTRGAHGGMTTLKTFWAYRDLDYVTVDLEALRQHLPSSAINQAIRAFIKAGGRDLKGCDIFEDTRL